MTYIGIVLGAIFGYGLAHRRKGQMLDKLQYAAGFGIAFGLLAMTLNVIILRLI